MLAHWGLLATIGLAFAGCGRSDPPATTTAPAATLPALRPTADWPSFAGNPAMPRHAPDIGPPPYRVRWTYRADSVGSRHTLAGFLAGAAIVSGTVYIPDSLGVVHALDLNTGQRRWMFRAKNGIESTPLVADGRVIVGDYSGDVFALDAATGGKLWTYDSGSSLESSVALAETAGRKLAVFGNSGAHIMAVALADGAEAWDITTGDHVYCTPTVHAGTALVACCDGNLRALDVATGSARFTATLPQVAGGSPAVRGDRIVVGTEEGHLVCLSLDGGRKLWQFDAPAVTEDGVRTFAPSPAITSGDDPLVILGNYDGRIYAIDLATGRQRWIFTTRAEVSAAAVVSGGRVYVGSKDKMLYVLDARTGENLWQFQAQRPIIAPVAIGNGALLVGDEGGNLYCLQSKAPADPAPAATRPR